MTRELLLLAAGTVVFDNAFIIASYVVHSNPIQAARAHSYVRYNAQLSLLALLALVLWFRPAVRRLVDALGPRARTRGSAAAVMMALVVPVVLWPWLRFDVEAPQPTLAALASAVAAHLHDGEKVALVLPGDGPDDALGSLLRGEILFSAPRRRIAEFRSLETLDARALDGLRREGFDHVLLTCDPKSHAPAAALIARDGGDWKTVAGWTYPPALAGRHFASLVPRQALCFGAADRNED
jgi:hypothetical protein